MADKLSQFINVKTHSWLEREQSKQRGENILAVQKTIYVCLSVRWAWAISFRFDRFAFERSFKKENSIISIKYCWYCLRHFTCLQYSYYKFIRGVNPQILIGCLEFNTHTLTYRLFGAAFFHQSSFLSFVFAYLHFY